MIERGDNFWLVTGPEAEASLEAHFAMLAALDRKHALPIETAENIGRGKLANTTDPKLRDLTPREWR